MEDRISRNKCAGCGGRFQWNLLCEVMNTLIIAENLIQIGLVVSEICPGKVKSRGGGRLFN